MKWHLLALCVACVWGSTFVASKVLILAGLTPAEIMTFRFLGAWLILLLFSHKQIVIPVKDELFCALLGLSGGSLYFLAENTAVKLTSATSTVALLVCTTPIITAVINRLIYKTGDLGVRFCLGSLVALAGVCFVVFNGVFVLDDNPLVIILSLLAALAWSLYSVIIPAVEGRYASDVITRKVFFWGVVTMLPANVYELVSGESNLFLQHGAFNFLMFSHANVWGTLLFLSLIASLACFYVWNDVFKHIGIVAANNYLYFNPVTSLIVAYIVLDEHITLLAVAGCLLTILGVYLCNRR
ncbi:MAG: DMT family transporter [Bacteroidales bacterium]|nr:DMT family transporter [Bacteroidales bacterium]